MLSNFTFKMWQSVDVDNQGVDERVSLKADYCSGKSTCKGGGVPFEVSVSWFRASCISK